MAKADPELAFDQWAILFDQQDASGWDNATCFDIQPPVEGPDLAAFLITQMDALAEIADRLHRMDSVLIPDEYGIKIAITIQTRPS